MVDKMVEKCAENKIMGATTEMSSAYIHPSHMLRTLCEPKAVTVGVTFINSLCCLQKFLLEATFFLC